MAQENFGSIWKRLLVYAPGIPIPLAQEFVNTAYSRALASWKWSQQRRDANFALPTVYSDGTVTVTQGSPIVTGLLTSFTAAMEGRQFFIGGIAPYYDIDTVDSSTQLTLTQNFNSATASAQSYRIALCYVEFPSDFLQLEVIRDLVNNWRLHLWVNQDLLGMWDAKRSVTGTPWIASAAAPKIIPDSTDPLVHRVELWPRQTGPYYYAYTYQAVPPILTDPTDRIIFPLRGDIIRHGALAELAQWPGTAKAPNPYFNLNLAQKHEQTFQDGLMEACREDNEFCQTQVRYIDDSSFPWAPIDAQFWQQHALF